MRERSVLVHTWEQCVSLHCVIAHITPPVTYSEVNFNQMWDDTLMMTVIPLTKIGILLNRPHYIEEAKFQFLTHINYLMDPRSGLWYHGWEFTPEGPTSGHNFANALWARGNCWITIAIPLFISILGDQLPPSDPIRKELVSVLRRQVDALVKCQDLKTGLWHTLLIDPTSYVESSAAAGFAAGMFMAIRMVSWRLVPAWPCIRSSHSLPCAQWGCGRWSTMISARPLDRIFSHCSSERLREAVMRLPLITADIPRASSPPHPSTSNPPPSPSPASSPRSARTASSRTPPSARAWAAPSSSTTTSRSPQCRTARPWRCLRW
jgi:unsaturated rhamnogalacturonyl hydrolase